MEQKIIKGYNVCDKLDDILTAIDVKKIFLVCGKTSYTLSGAEKSIGSLIERRECIKFNDFDSNPSIDDIKRGFLQLKDKACDMIMGVGGGSAIDIAKALSILIENRDDIDPAIRGNIELNPRKIPSIMVPTTPGTGSESTHFSVIYINQKKYSLSHPSMLPDYAILDPSFLISLPPYTAACSGMDALCQAIESFWSVHSTDESRGYSKQSAAAILDCIVDYVNHPDNVARQRILFAGNMSGRAINIAKTTAAHAMSYPITSFFNLPHGHAVSMVMPHVLRRNCEFNKDPLNDTRGASFVRNIMNSILNMLNASSPEQAEKTIVTIMKKIDLAISLSEAGIEKKDAGDILFKGMDTNRMKNNPIAISETDIKKIIKKII